MTLKEIVAEYLKTNGYDGLFNGDCACLVDDLLPCEHQCDDCIPGYKVPCDWHIRQDAGRIPRARGWHIQRVRPKPKE